MVERTCIRCRGRAAKAELLRLVWADGRVQWDESHRAPGRGAYLHPSCAVLSISARSIARALRVPSGRVIELPPLG